MNDVTSSTRDPQARIQTTCLIILVAIALTYVVYWLRPVLVPFVVSIFVVSGVTPILELLEQRLNVSRLVAAGLTFLSGFAILVVFGISIWLSVLDLSNNASGYRSRVRELVSEIEDKLPISLSNETNNTSSDRNRVPLTQGEKVTSLIDGLVGNAISIVSQTFLSLVSTSLVVLIFVFFLLLGSPAIDKSHQTVQEINKQVRTYLSLKTVISIFTGFSFGLALHLFGVPMAFTFGVLAFLLNFVPNVGPIAASLLPVPLIVFAPDATILWMVSVLVVINVIQLISGNVVEPKLMGESSDLHPVTILLALMFWGVMWGVIGMFLATPITAAIRIVLERLEQTRPIALLMAGRYGKKIET
ncbi:MAG: AI-2E family transporter [Rubripirellula sp.]|nr:AI-2E family transporter [Rubripirellula sp.]